MKTVTVTEAKAHLSRLLGLVRRGESVVILHRGRPVARLEPVGPLGDEREESRIERLVREGVVRRGTQPPDAGALEELAVELPDGHGLLAALLEERDEGP
jgi:prevent-host-death family protein